MYIHVHVGVVHTCARAGQRLVSGVFIISLHFIIIVVVVINIIILRLSLNWSSLAGNGWPGILPRLPIQQREPGAHHYVRLAFCVF